jgi:hypothetical protein
VASTAKERGREVASTATDRSREVATTAADRGREVASTAVDRSRQVATTAKERAGEVVEEVTEQGRNLVEETRANVEEQVQVQTTRLAESLSRLAQEAEALAGGRPDAAPTVTEYVSQAGAKLNDAAEALYGVADDVASRGIGAVAEDLGQFARRRPGAFLVGAALLGFGVGRVVRGSSDGAGEQAEGAPSPAPRRRAGVAGAR